jgi:hypothetical protein
MSLIEELNKTIEQSPSLIQVAINGMWEDTWKIPFDDGLPSIAAINQYLEKGAEGIAIEVFFKTTDGYNIMFGIRFIDRLVTTSPREFLVTSFNSIWAEKPLPFVTMITELSEKLTGDPKSLFRVDPTGVELGVINWWKSMGSLEIWNSSEVKTINKEDLKKQLEVNPHLLKNNKNYVAVDYYGPNKLVQQVANSPAMIYG